MSKNKIRQAKDHIAGLSPERRSKVKNYRTLQLLAARELHGQHVTINWQASGDPLVPEVNHGRWIVQCPYCDGAAFAEEGEPFFCAECLMLENGGMARPVAFPETKDQIEAVLLRRDQDKNRNWKKTESIDDLKRENREHGHGED